eukprot:3630321-Alexandrium_andersonii.AAC.1
MLLLLASRTPRAKDCADCGLADCGFGARYVAISRPRTPSSPVSTGGFGISARNGAERTPRELRGSTSMPFLGLGSS